MPQGGGQCGGHHRIGGSTGPGVHCTRSYWCRKRRSGSTSGSGPWCILGCLFGLVMALTTTLTVHYTTPRNYNPDDAKMFDPTDTRIIPISSPLCQDVKVKTGDGGAKGYTTTLYMLSSRPNLTGSENFGFNDQPSYVSDKYRFYYYYMYPGSNFTVSACLLTPTWVTFYLFKGHKQFGKWRDDRFSESYVTEDFGIVSSCGDGRWTYSYQVESADYYYLVFEANIDNPLNITASFHRTRYELTNSSIVESCSVNSSVSSQSCSLSLPFSGHIPFLEISRNPGTPENWLDGVDVSTSCAPRIWMYAVISLCALVGAVGIVASLTVCCIFMHRSKKKAQGSAANTTTKPVSEKPTAPLLTNKLFPLPINPDYDPESGGSCEDTLEPPPAYKP